MLDICLALRSLNVNACRVNSRTLKNVRKKCYIILTKNKKLKTAKKCFFTKLIAEGNRMVGRQVSRKDITQGMCELG